MKHTLYSLAKLCIDGEATQHQVTVLANFALVLQEQRNALAQQLFANNIPFTLPDLTKGRPDDQRN